MHWFTMPRLGQEMRNFTSNRMIGSMLLGGVRVRYQGLVSFDVEPSIVCAASRYCWFSAHDFKPTDFKSVVVWFAIG